MGEEKSMTMLEDLRGWGVGLIIIGGIHLFIPLLAFEWGMILIPLGILTLAVKHRGMFIVIGIALIFVGLLNIAGTLNAGIGFWTVFGGLQIYWGIKEMAKFPKYSVGQEEKQLHIESETVKLESSREV